MLWGKKKNTPVCSSPSPNPTHTCLNSISIQRCAAAALQTLSLLIGSDTAAGAIDKNLPFFMDHGISLVWFLLPLMASVSVRHVSWDGDSYKEAVPCLSQGQCSCIQDPPFFLRWFQTSTSTGTQLALRLTILKLFQRGYHTYWALYFIGRTVWIFLFWQYYIFFCFVV